MYNMWYFLKQGIYSIKDIRLYVFKKSTYLILTPHQQIFVPIIKQCFVNIIL